MATVYKAVVTLANDQKVVEAATPAALGIAIGNVIQTEPVNDVEVVYEVLGPLSRRKTE